MRRQPFVITAATLAEEVFIRSDQNFFRQNPRRNFRVRPAYAAEIKDLADQDMHLPELPPELCWWIAVRQLGPGARCRCPFAARHDLPCEVSEETAREIWTQIQPPGRPT